MVYVIWPRLNGLVKGCKPRQDGSRQHEMAREFTLIVFHQTEKVEEYETKTVEREFQIQKTALRLNKLHLLYDRRNSFLSDLMKS